jgi:arsenite methyltransferase
MRADVVDQRREVLSFLVPQSRERVLDIGSGPGYLLALIAEVVVRRVRHVV